MENNVREIIEALRICVLENCAKDACPYYENSDCTVNLNLDAANALEKMIQESPRKADDATSENDRQPDPNATAQREMLKENTRLRARAKALTRMMQALWDVLMENNDG